MKFRRKSGVEASEAVGEAEFLDEAGASEGEAEAPAGPPSGPYDLSEMPDDGIERVDLGSLLIGPAPKREIRLQVEEGSQVVQAALVAGPDGAVELRAFAAPRNGDLWSTALEQIAAEAAQVGGTATEREGRFGIELLCRRPVQLPDGTTSLQPSRVVGINGSRWLLRATFLGRPAVDPDNASDWDDTLAGVVVNRGQHAMPVGDPLPITLPADARRVPRADR